MTGCSGRGGTGRVLCHERKGEREDIRAQKERGEPAARELETRECSRKWTSKKSQELSHEGVGCKKTKDTGKQRLRNGKYENLSEIWKSSSTDQDKRQGN